MKLDYIEMGKHKVELGQILKIAEILKIDATTLFTAPDTSVNNN